MERKGLALLQYHIALFVLTEIDKDTPKTLGRDFIATTGGTTMPLKLRFIFTDSNENILKLTDARKIG